MVSSDVQADSYRSDRFATTRWSIVLAAGQKGTTDSVDALSTLCQLYWYPLYAYIRRQGTQPEEAQDLVQDFFTRVIEKEYLQSADQERGKFRSFLLTVFKRFRANQRQRDRAAKRGGGQAVLSLDFESGEQWYGREPADHWTPERVFERQWALTLLGHVLDQLADDYHARGRTELFEQLKGFLTPAVPTESYEQIATRLGMSTSAVKVAVHRLRNRYRDRLRNEIAHTVDGEENVDEELQYLLAALRGAG